MVGDPRNMGKVAIINMKVNEDLTEKVAVEGAKI